MEMSMVSYFEYHSLTGFESCSEPNHCKSSHDCYGFGFFFFITGPKSSGIVLLRWISINFPFRVLCSFFSLLSLIPGYLSSLQVLFTESCRPLRKEKKSLVAFLARYVGFVIERTRSSGKTEEPCCDYSIPRKKFFVRLSSRLSATMCGYSSRSWSLGVIGNLLTCVQQPTPECLHVEVIQ